MVFQGRVSEVRYGQREFPIGGGATVERRGYGTTITTFTVEQIWKSPTVVQVETTVMSGNTC